MAAPLFRPERLGHACGAMPCAVSSYLFLVICAMQQSVLIDRRGLERDHHFAGRWRTDVGDIDGFGDLGRIAERLDLYCFHGSPLSTDVGLPLVCNDGTESLDYNPRY